MLNLPSVLSLKTTAIAAGAAFLLGVTSASISGIYIHNWRVDSLKKDWDEAKEKEIAAAELKIQEKCDANAKITMEETHELQTALDKLDADYDRLRRQKPIVARCLPITHSLTGNTGANAATENPEGMGVNTEWLDRAFYDTNRDILTGVSAQRLLCRIYREAKQEGKLGPAGIELCKALLPATETPK